MVLRMSEIMYREAEEMAKAKATLESRKAKEEIWRLAVSQNDAYTLNEALTVHKENIKEDQ